MWVRMQVPHGCCGTAPSHRGGCRLVRAQLLPRRVAPRLVRLPHLRASTHSHTRAAAGAVAVSPGSGPNPTGAPLAMNPPTFEAPGTGCTCGASGKCAPHCGVSCVCSGHAGGGANTHAHTHDTQPPHLLLARQPVLLPPQLAHALLEDRVLVPADRLSWERARASNTHQCEILVVHAHHQLRPQCHWVALAATFVACGGTVCSAPAHPPGPHMHTLYTQQQRAPG